MRQTIDVQGDTMDTKHRVVETERKSSRISMTFEENTRNVSATQNIARDR